jgi:phage/plasmid-associated DNA primase
MDSDLRNLLKNVSKGDTKTHQCAYSVRDPICISPSERKVFWEGYCDLVAQNRKNLCVGEIPKEHSPAVLTFKFKYEYNEQEIDWEPYDDLFVEWLCYTFQQVLEEMFVLSEDNAGQMVCVVLETEKPYYTKDENGEQFMNLELVLHFPYAGMSFSMYNAARTRFVQLLRNNNIMGKITRQPLGDWNSIVSAPKKDDMRLLYGSCMKKEGVPLKLTKIFGVIEKNTLEESLASDSIELEDVFFPENHSHIDGTNIDMEMIGEKELSHWLPIFLSTQYNYASLRLKAGKETLRQKRYTRNIKNFGQLHEDRNNQHEETELDNCERLISMLDTKRYTAEPYWLDIGRALYNATNCGEDGILSWIRHTKQAIQKIGKTPSFLEKGDKLDTLCRETYMGFSGPRITYETICIYAMEDNPEEYKLWDRDEWCLPSMEKALSLCHNDVSEALYKTEHLYHAYTPGAAGRGIWHNFQNHKWVESHGGIFLRKIISTKFLKRFESIRLMLYKEIHASEDENYRSKAEAVIKKITALIVKLKTVSFKNSIMSEASEFFFRHRFMTFLDTNPNLTGFTNGILEVVGENIVFRNGKPEDYVTMSANIAYNTNYTWKHPLVKEVTTWMSQVFTNETLLHHFYKFSASCLKGYNHDKTFPIFSGVGDNSKSMIVKLFEKAFGDYCMKLDIANFTSSSKNAAAANPQLARAKGVKIAFIDEPDDDDPLKKDNFKKLLGMDSITVRKLYDNGGDMDIMLKIVMCCNAIPRFANADQAVKNRLRIYPFLSRWVRNPPATEKERIETGTFLMNTLFSTRIASFAPAFIWVISNYYGKYAREGLVDPEIVTLYTANYWSENDTYGQFITDCIQVMKLENGDYDPSYKSTFNEVCAEFRIWHKNSFPNSKLPERSVQKREFTVRWGRMVGNSWDGVKIGNADQKPTDLTKMLSTVIGSASKTKENPEQKVQKSTSQKVAIDNTYKPIII